MKINLAKAALEGVRIKLEAGESEASLKNTIDVAHDAVAHHMRVKYAECKDPAYRLYFVIGGCKVYAGGDESVDQTRSRHSVACSLDVSGLLSKVKSYIMDSQYNIVAEIG